MERFDLHDVSDENLLARLESLVRSERRGLPHLLACLAEVDRRGAYKKPGFSSVFEYCTGRLGYSEDAAYARVQAARAASRFPEIYSLLADGSLSLSVAAKLAPHLAPDNSAELLGRAQGQGKRAVEAMLAVMFPRPDPPERIRPLRGPASVPSGSAGGPGPLPAPGSARPSSASAAQDGRTAAPAIELQFPAPAEPERFEFSFSGSKALRDSLERAKDLLWHRIPQGRLEDILLEVLREYLDRHDPQLRLKVPPRRTRARENSRGSVPAWVRAKVWARDAGRCAYAAADGRRCQARRGLELDHIRPRALGGPSDDPANIRLLCRAHNDYERRRVLGEGGRLG